MSIKDILLPLENQGLLLLNGKNLDNPALNNNGSGKSSIIEAIVYSLYGRTLRGVRGDLVVNRIIGADMRLELQLVDDDEVTYTIIRHRKHNKYKNKSLLYREEQNITPKSEADFDAYITKLLQADFIIFTASLLYSSESFKFSTASDNEIKKAFETMLGLDILSVAHEIAKQNLKDTQTELLSSVNSISDKKAQITRFEAQLQDLHDKQQEYLSARKQKIEYLEQSIASLDEKDDNLHTELRSLFNRLESLQDNERSTVQAIDEANQDMFQLDELKDKLTATNQRISEITSKISSNESLWNTYENLIKKANKSIAQHKKEIETIQSKITDVESQIGTPCVTCGRLLTKESLQSVVEEYQSKQTTLQKKLEEELENIQELSVESSTCETQIDSLTSVLKVLNEEKNTTQNQINSSDIKTKLTELETNLRSIQSQVSSTKNDINCKNLEIKQNNDTMRDLNRQLRDIESEVKSDIYADLISDIQENLQANQDALKSLQDKQEDWTKLETKLQFWTTAYSNQGIKSYILDDVTPFLNRKLNKYLSKLTSGQIEAVFSTQTELKSGDKREKFNLEILNTGDGQYQSNSAGEKKRIDLSINLALQDLVASRSSKKLNIALFDEVFDSLDDKGIEGVVALLRELSAEKSTILVITHNEHLKSYFTNYLTVVKQNGLSDLTSNVY